MIKKVPQYKVLTDNAILIEFEQNISPQILVSVMAMDHLVQKAEIYGVIETVPAYASLSVFYNPMVWDFDALVKKLKKISLNAEKTELPKSALLEVPVCYDEQYAPDLVSVARHTGLSVKEVIKIHSQQEYLVYMLGFLPGFIYLGGMDERLITPRKASPDLKTASGSVAIGGSQTGIYSIESPAGWNIIGRTPQSFFDLKSEIIFRIKQGDRIKFIPIKKEHFDSP